jgi:hypothetical protein
MVSCFGGPAAVNLPKHLDVLTFYNGSSPNQLFNDVFPFFMIVIWKYWI